MKKAKILCLILAFLMIFGSVMSAQAAENNFFDIRLNSAPNNYNAGYDTSDSVVSENDSFSVDVNGTVTDTRLNSAPDGYSPSGTRTNAEQIVPDISSVQTMPCATELMPTGGGEYSYNPTYWNDEANVYRSNCYGYALNLIANIA